jgi:hypothetical protein
MTIEFYKYIKKLPLFFRVLLWPFIFIFGIIITLYYFLLSLLPHPEINENDRFIVIKGFKSNCLTHFNGPYTLGFECMVPKGTILIAYHASEIISAGFSCIPEKPQEFEQFIPIEQRNDPKYQSFSIGLRYRDIGYLIDKIV